MKRIIIAIDGHSSSGKSTMAKDLARQIGYTYIDTGAMYRAVTLYCMQHNLFEGEQIKEKQLQELLPEINLKGWSGTSVSTTRVYFSPAPSVRVVLLSSILVG